MSSRLVEFQIHPYHTLKGRGPFTSYFKVHGIMDDLDKALQARGSGEVGSGREGRDRQGDRRS